MNDRITIRLDDESRQQIEELSRAVGASPSTVIRTAVDSYYRTTQKRRRGRAKRETVYDIMLRAGLIGCIKDGPPDLSTNPKYMEGFGERPNRARRRRSAGRRNERARRGA
jgi:hypothetical protein